MGGTNFLVGKRLQARVVHSRAEVPSIVAWPPLLRFCGSAPALGVKKGREGHGRSFNHIDKYRISLAL